MTARLALAAAAILLATAASQAAPLCDRVGTGRMVPCWSDAKIDAAVTILQRRGEPRDRDYVISIEMNRGKFASARALADWISYGD